MVVIERASSLCSSSSSSSSKRKEKQNLNEQKGDNVLPKHKILRKASSLSSRPPPSPRKVKSGVSSPKSGVSSPRVSNELRNKKLAGRSSSLSSSSLSSKEKEKRGSDSPRKEKSVVSSPKSGVSSPRVRNELRKEKLAGRVSSLSSSSLSSKEKENRGSDSPRKENPNVTKEKQNDQRKSASFKSRIKDMGPICKRRKETLAKSPLSVKVVEDIDEFLNKQIEEDEKANPDDCLWLSSGSLSPQEFGLFMSSLDPCVDELIISFLPNSASKPKPADDQCSEEDQKLQSCVKEEDVVCSQSIDSCASSLELSTYTEPSSFWTMDRTGVWVSTLINLEGEDSKFISDVDSQVNELESNFPSPTYETNWDSYSSDVGFSSSARSTQDTSQSDWSSEFLSSSMDLEESDSDDPIFWPYGVDVDWDDQKWDSFSISPRKGVRKYTFESGENGSIRMRLHARKDSSKEGLKRKIVFVSGLSASKIIEFKKGCRRGKKSYSKHGKRTVGSFKRRVATILENIQEEGKSPKTPEAKVDLSTAMLSDDLGDSDGPLVWPSDQKSEWNPTWDSFNISPRKGAQNTSLGSPKGGFAVSSSVRLKFRHRKGKCKGLSGFPTSRTLKFKSNSHKKTAATGGSVKAMPFRVATSSKGFMVLVRPTLSSMFKSTAFNRTNANGKRVRAMPMKFGGTSVEEFMRLAYFAAKTKSFTQSDHDTDSMAEDIPIEMALGLSEFDGHEGVDAEFEGDCFSLENYMEE